MSVTGDLEHHGLPQLDTHELEHWPDCLSSASKVPNVKKANGGAAA